jgi:hypothetical protein
VEGTVILKGIGVMGVGLLFVWLGLLGWKSRREERMNLVEAAILKVGNAEPLPRDRWDRMFAYLQPILMLIFGPLMILLGLLLIFV